MFWCVSRAITRYESTCRTTHAGRTRPQPPDDYNVRNVARILISGASGLIGNALVLALQSRGDEIYRLVRRLPSNEREIPWDPLHGIEPKSTSGFDAVIHLSGETVAGRWTAARKRSIRDSRVISTQHLATALAQTEKPPHTFLCASAIGYYGNRGDELLTEQSAPGDGFLAEVCREWEAATQPAAAAGIRVANLRMGVVLSRRGGALQQMLLPFRLGLGGRIGSGRQWFSWIHIDDVVAAVLHILENLIIRGPVNMVSPNPLTNTAFTKALAQTLRRPAIFPVPAFVLRLAFGQFAEEGLLSSARVIPQKLIESGFHFRYPDIQAALTNTVRGKG